MIKTLVWDLPTRFFHWAFAGSLSASFAIALLVSHHHPLFQLHMLFGLVAMFLLVVRLLLGLFGSRHARFASFPLRPGEVLRYFPGALAGRARAYAGNNPGSALAALAMFALVPAVVVTGIGRGGEALEEAHEVLAYALLAVIGAHLLGLVLHTLWHRENIAAAMLTGRKPAPPEQGLRSSHPVWAAVVAGVSLAWIVALFAGHDARASTVKLPLLGLVLHLGENEDADGRRGRDEHEHERGRASGSTRPRPHDDDGDDD